MDESFRNPKGEKKTQVSPPLKILARRLSVEDGEGAEFGGVAVAIHQTASVAAGWPVRGVFVGKSEKQGEGDQTENGSKNHIPTGKRTMGIEKLYIYLLIFGRHSHFAWFFCAHFGM